MTDHAKRKLLKTIAVSGMGVGASLYLPLGLADASSTGLTASHQTQSGLPQSGLSVEHYENFTGHTVLIRNTTQNALALSHIYPSVLTTPKGEVDLRNLLQQGELIIPANCTQAFSISTNGQVNKYALWQHITDPETVSDGSAGYYVMDVTGRYNSSHETQLTRVHRAIVA